MLMADRVDFAVLDVTVLRGIPALHVDPLGRLDGVYVCRAGHPLLRKRPLKATDMHAYPLVHSNVSTEHAYPMEDIDPGLTIDDATGSILQSIAVASCRLMYDMVEASDAISIARISQVEERIAQGRMAVLDLPWKARPPCAEFGIACKQERTLPPAARMFIGLIRKRMRAIAKKAVRAHHLASNG
jgi:DNA-binding transcriptional LysR family regulator